jgi:hypothetical protein
VNPFREWLIIAPLVLLSNVKSIWISKPVKSGMRPPPPPSYQEACGTIFDSYQILDGGVGSTLNGRPKGERFKSLSDFLTNVVVIPIGIMNMFTMLQPKQSVLKESLLQSRKAVIFT